MKWIEINPCTEIQDAAIAIVFEANTSGEEVRAKFNSFTLIALPHQTDEDELIAAYYRHMAGNELTRHADPGTELGAEIILTTVGLLRDMLLHGFGEDKFNAFRMHARKVVTKAQQLPECGGSSIKAARDVFNADVNFGNQLNNGQKAMLFIAAVELMQEQAQTAEDVTGK